MAKAPKPAEKNMSIRFMRGRQVRDHNGEVVQSFRQGEVVEMTESSARHWLSRNIAKPVTAGEAEDQTLDGDELTARIAEVIDGLDAESDFTKDGVPTTDALAREIGQPVSAAERDAGVAAYDALDGGAGDT